MLTSDQITALRDISGQIIDPVVEFLIEDIARRVSEAGQLTSTAAYQVWQAQKLGLSQRQLKKELRKRLKVSHRELRQLLTQAAQAGYNFDISRFPQVQAFSFEENTMLQQILDATVKLAQEDLTNVTQTIGFVAPNGKCMELTEAYQKTCDFAFQKVVNGAQDYNAAIREATRYLAEKGIRTIDYDSGVHTSLEAAVRRNIMGGLGLMNEIITQQNHDDLGCDGWEISAHAGSAPDHEPIQGKQYSDEAFTRLNNSLVRRIGTLNCGHFAMPIILGVNAPQYTPEELEAFRRQNEEGIDFEGKHYTLYEATQRQRRLERSIRNTKRKILIDEATGDTEKLQWDQIRLVRLREEYHRFSKAAGLPEQYARMEKAGFSYKHGKAAEKAAKVAEKQPLVKILHPKIAPSETPAAPNYMDITGKWHPDAEPNSHPVRDLDKYVVDGVTYKVDGRNVQLDYKPHEKEIAELLAREVGGEVFMVPRVNNPQGVSTPDYIFNGKAYDLKTLSKEATENTIFNRVKKARKQAHNFIIDVSDTTLSDEVIEAQIKKLFENNSTVFVDEIVIIRSGVITKVVKRK